MWPLSRRSSFSSALHLRVSSKLTHQHIQMSLSTVLLHNFHLGWTAQGNAMFRVLLFPSLALCRNNPRSPFLNLPYLGIICVTSAKKSFYLDCKTVGWFKPNVVFWQTALWPSQASTQHSLSQNECVNVLKIKMHFKKQFQVHTRYTKLCSCVLPNQTSLL